MSGISLRTAQLQVLSQALAHFAHDVQNHLAIINESAGWMKDLLTLNKKQKFGWIRRLSGKDQKKRNDLEPYFSDLNKIEKHVNQASVMTRNLSSFVHRLEKERSVFNSSKALEEIRDVLLRQAGDKGIRLELKLAAGSSMIETNPAVFQLAVFGNVEKVMENLESGERLTIESGTEDGRFQVRLTGPCPGGYNASLTEEPDEQDFYWYIIKNLGGQIQKQCDDKECVTTLSFALTRSET